MADNQNKQPLEGKALNELLKVRKAFYTSGNGQRSI